MSVWLGPGSADLTPNFGLGQHRRACARAMNEKSASGAGTVGGESLVLAHTSKSIYLVSLVVHEFLCEGRANGERTREPGH